MKRILSMMLAVAMVFSLLPSIMFSASAAEITPTEPALTTDKYDINGDDTMDAVYEITTASELYWFAGLVNGTLSGVYVNDTVTYRGFVGCLGGSVKNLTVADSDFYISSSKPFS